MSSLATDIALKPLAILSLLADGPSPDAATRVFRGKPVLLGTLERLCAAASELEIVILAWDDQFPSLQKILDDASIIQSVGPRKVSSLMNAASASLRWADGWRGGLLGVSTFDRGFDAASILSALEKRDCNAAMFVDPSAALIEPAAIDAAIRHLAECSTIDYAFHPGTPGSGTMILRIGALAELQRTSRLPGQLLAYHPDRPIHDPIAKEPAVPVSQRVARSLARLIVDSGRQAARLSLLQADDAESMVEALGRDGSLDAMPREVIVELTAVRATKPIFSILNAQAVDRAPMTLDTANRIFEQLAPVDDIRLTFAGVGDPLLHPRFDPILRAARSAGIRAIHVETDLLATNRSSLDLLASGAVDVVSIHLPAVHRDTYREVMGVDRVGDVLEGLKLLVMSRAKQNTGLPLIAPIFTKCERNLAEMEDWYDQWIRAVGAAVIRGPSDFGGAIPFVGVSDMMPSVRRACRRVRSRMTILSDGTIASCEEDVLGRQRVGAIGSDSIDSAWSDGMRPLRMSVHAGSVCAACRMWDRP